MVGRADSRLWRRSRLRPITLRPQASVRADRKADRTWPDSRSSLPSHLLREPAPPGTCLDSGEPSPSGRCLAEELVSTWARVYAREHDGGPEWLSAVSRMPPIEV